jgi:cytochrome bd-type quinol oxidase subunit 2
MGQFALENLLVSINVIVPLVLLIALGYLLKRTNNLSEEVFKGLNRLVFTVLLPCAMFQNIISSNRDAIFRSQTLGYSLIVFLIFLVVSFLLVMKLEKDPRKHTHSIAEYNSHPEWTGHYNSPWYMRPGPELIYGVAKSLDGLRARHPPQQEGER